MIAQIATTPQGGVKDTPDALVGSLLCERGALLGLGRLEEIPRCTDESFTRALVASECHSQHASLCALSFYWQVAPNEREPTVCNARAAPIFYSLFASRFGVEN